jgi:folate-binding protein YgfZ
MASITLCPRANTTLFVCDSCLNTLRPRRSQLGAVRRLNTPAAQNAPPPRFSATATRAIIARTAQQTRQNYPRRRYATDVTIAPHPALSSKGLAPLPNRRLISLSGPDAAKFLQGLITNNVDAHPSSPFYCAFLSARGRVLWDAFIWVLPAKEWACYIEVDSEEADSLMKHLKRHKLRSKITIASVPENEIGVWSAWGFTESQLQDDSLISSFLDPRAPDFGVRCLFQGNQGMEGRVDPPFPILDTQQYHIRRYLYGIPEGPKEIQRENALPMEFNFDLSDGIDFRKGCYVGQELTIRTKHTGVVRKRILPVQLYRAGDSLSTEEDMPKFDPTWTIGESLESGTDIKPLPQYADAKRVRATGKYIAGIGNVGLALCRLEMMTDMGITNEGGSYKPGSEFIVKDAETPTAEDTVRIKAIVPQWFREKERAVWSKGRRPTMAAEVDGV